MIHHESHVALPQRRRTAAPARNSDLLTETQILAMPDDEYMSERQLTFFSSLLAALEATLVAKAQRADGEIAAGAVEADPVDRASIEEEHRMALSTRARDAGQLLEVRAALARIGSGDFGYCAETGDPIGIARLLVRPTTVLTTEAQQRKESMTRRFRV
ncbi:TraR/DksA family transcriptional regulator [Massilia sp. LjRoot122]|uniref:TraR/DksA family transcriptional regulator n=1 Tax=Massilia sp. LjRoot122 TaxID=3342257 RepID=UPI003ECE5B57